MNQSEIEEALKLADELNGLADKHDWRQYQAINDSAGMIRKLVAASEKYKKMYFEESFKNKHLQDIIKLEQNK